MSDKTKTQQDTENLRNTLLFLLAMAVTMAILAISTAAWLDSRSTPMISIFSTPQGDFVVEVRGAVATPGVVYLEPGARMIDAIDAAGGFAGDADRSLINLSGRLIDGQVVMVPAMQEQTVGTAQSGLININTASVDDLKQLPGIGDVLAQRIVAYREFNGPFQSVDDLIEIEGISQTLVDSIRDLVTVSDHD